MVTKPDETISGVTLQPTQMNIDHDKYEAVIGLEVHVQLFTNSKDFSSDATSYGDAPVFPFRVVILCINSYR